MKLSYCFQSIVFFSFAVFSHSAQAESWTVDPTTSALHEPGAVQLTFENKFSQAKSVARTNYSGLWTGAVKLKKDTCPVNSPLPKGLRFSHQVTQFGNAIEMFALNSQDIFLGRTTKDGFYAGRSDSDEVCTYSIEERYEKIKANKAKTVRVLLSEKCSFRKNICKAEYNGSGTKH